MVLAQRIKDKGLVVISEGHTCVFGRLGWTGTCISETEYRSHLGEGSCLGRVCTFLFAHISQLFFGFDLEIAFNILRLVARFFVRSFAFRKMFFFFFLLLHDIHTLLMHFVIANYQCSEVNFVAIL